MGEKQLNLRDGPAGAELERCPFHQRDLLPVMLRLWRKQYYVSLSLVIKAEPCPGLPQSCSISYGQITG